MTDAPTLKPTQRRLRTLAVFLVGALLSLGTFLLARHLMLREVAFEFRAAAMERARSLIAGLDDQFNDVAVLQSFYESSSDVTLEDFEAFTEPLLARHPSILAFQWLPQVDHRNRPRLEAEGRRFHPDFRFFQRDAAGQLLEIPRLDSFFAILYVKPYAGNESALGFSANHLSTRQQTLARAIQTGKLSVSGRLRLIQGGSDQFGILVMAPVRRKDGQIRGVVQGVFRVENLVQASLAALEPRGLDIQLLDASTPGAEALLHREPSRLPPRGPATSTGLHLEQTFELGGRSWELVVKPTGGYFPMDTPWQAWAVLAAGLAISGLLASYIHFLLTRQGVIAEQVKARTAELSLEVSSHQKDLQALKESEARFHQLVEVMDEGMWVLDVDARTTFVNPRMAEMLGYSAQEMLGRTLFEFMAPEDVQLSHRRLENRREGIPEQYDFRFLKKDGSDLWALVVGTPIRDDLGQTVSFLGMITDITQRRKDERAQTENQKLESLGVLAGGIAHDFNNLLTAIQGNINLAQLVLPKVSPALPYLVSMERTVERATNLTRQMLAYSGKGRFVVELLNLNHAVQEISHLLSVSISKKVTLRYQLEPDLPLCMADASQMQQVVMNLVTNASEAMGDEEGSVCIRTNCKSYLAKDLHRDFPGQSILPGTFVTLEVSDTGQGMSAAVQARIFEPFFTTKFTGRGLGLAAMQGIVRGHGGGIRVYSEEGKGTSFRLIFPASQAVPAQCAAPIQMEEWVGSGTILVVDDEPTILQVASALLRSMGFQVLTAADGQEGLEVFRQHREAIRAVLLDLTMPRLNGLETFQELRLLQPDCCVVLTSGYNEEDAVRDFAGKGLAGFVQKPFQREHLQVVLGHALSA